MSATCPQCGALEPDEYGETCTPIDPKTMQPRVGGVWTFYRCVKCDHRWTVGATFMFANDVPPVPQSP